MCGLSSLAVWAGMAGGAAAMELDTGGPVKVRLDNTVKYSVGMRVADPDDGLLGGLNGDDGDRAFNKWGLTSNRVDLLSEFDVSYEDFGFRASGAAWFDAAYLGRNANDSAGTVNQTSQLHDEFSDGVRSLHLWNAELLDAFVYGKATVADVPIRVRAGRHTMLWGESLFMAGNSIAFGQAPTDVAKLLGVPSTQAKELFMPVTQISGTVQATEALSFASYVQFEWRPNRLPAAGSYFSSTDVLDEGGERILLAPNGPYFSRGDDVDPSHFGQFGLSMRYRSDDLDTDFGLYALNYHDKYPRVYLRPGAGRSSSPLEVGTYEAVYGENIQMFGASASTSVGDWNVAAEVSYRHDTPLNSAIQTDLTGTADGDDNVLFARGDTLHAQVSGILFLGANALWDGGSFLGEIGGHQLLRFTENKDAFDQTRDHTALGMRFLLEPAYYQVIPGLDITVPVGMGFNFLGNSPVDPKFNGGAHLGGDVSMGLGFTYENTWKGSVNYTHYYGDHDTQDLLDRDYVSLSVQRTF